MTHKDQLTVSIQPDVGIISVLRHLNYKPWYALAEFVDNAIASFLANRAELRKRGSRRLVVDIVLKDDPPQLAIRDDAAGISLRDYRRAFRPAEAPPDRSGLSEFGMGMKAAACWFARVWSVRTCALGEGVERTLTFDVEQIIRDGIAELRPTTGPAVAGDHYTEVVLSSLHRMPVGRTVGKMKEHLASIYRVFIRDDVLELRFNGQPLRYDEPAVLRAPYFKTLDGPVKEWRKKIDMDLGMGLRAQGFAALRETGSTSDAGFALFRRGRLIQGSGDEGYRPEAIFGKSNSYTYQRLFGELHLEGFDVSHTKDGIRWEEHEDEFVDLLNDELDRSPLPLRDQAEGFRARLKPRDVQPAADGAVRRTSDAIRTNAPPVVSAQMAATPSDTLPPVDLPGTTPVSRRAIDVEFNGVPWRIIVELTTEPAAGEWVELSDSLGSEDQVGDPEARRVGVRMSLSHPFTARFAGTDAACIEALLRVAAALALAETAARAGGVRKAGVVRHNLNELLRKALSKP